MEKINTELVNEGFSLLHPVMVERIVKSLKKQYGGRWWDEVLDALKDQWSLPGYGEEKELISCLDRANCCRLFMRRSRDLFPDPSTAASARTWATELMGVRNELAHDSIHDLPQKDAERYLDTMARLAAILDPRCAERVRELYQKARSLAPDIARPAPEGYYPTAQQRASQGAGVDLLSIREPGIVEPTGLSRKITINGQTLAYPVYRVRLDQLFYNDRNDRILTWISQYRDEFGVEDLSSLSREEYNRIIEQFIINSNPAAIEKTRNNIALVNQREPGVTLSDGRIVDGNRRFTCLRMLHREDPAFNYFETVILSQSPADSAKQIKLLELAIQHGEEAKVDYNQIDTVIGAYLDIVETGLITAEEYAASTNETVAEVRRKLELAQLIMEFLAFMHTPGQYHVARDLQVYSVFVELLPLLNKCRTGKEREELKRSVFTNTMLGTFADQRKYIRSLRTLFGSPAYKTYMQRESKAAEQMSRALEEYGIGGMEDLKDFVSGQEPMRTELAMSMEKALNQSKKAQSKSKPARNVAKCVELLLEIDTEIFPVLSREELDQLRGQLNRLAEAEALLKRELPED